MKSLSGVVTNSLVSVKTSDITSSEMHHCEFSIGNIEVAFSSDRDFGISDGDFVIVAGTMKGNRMRAFSVYDLSIVQQRSSGVVSNLFFAAFAAFLGLFGVVITAAFLAPFSYVILVFAVISVSCLFYRAFASFAACSLVWYRRYSLATGGKVPR
jgi:hypothetical protein